MRRAPHFLLWREKFNLKISISWWLISISNSSSTNDVQLSVLVDTNVASSMTIEKCSTFKSLLTKQECFYRISNLDLQSRYRWMVLDIRLSLTLTLSRTSLWRGSNAWAWTWQCSTLPILICIDRCRLLPHIHRWFLTSTELEFALVGWRLWGWFTVVVAEW